MITESQTESQTESRASTSERSYARTLANSRRVRWEIDSHVLRGRELDFNSQFLPDGLSLVSQFPFLSVADRRHLSHIQGRTYANVFGLVERFIAAKVLELSHDYWLGDQTALEALVGFSQEELKHQELFRRLEQMIASGMPAGYRFAPKPDEVARAVLASSTWAVLALTCHIELFTQVHYRESIEPDLELSPLFKDVFLFHWKDEAQHAILDELEWKRIDRQLSPSERDRGVDDFIALVGAVDGILQAQAEADVTYFTMTAANVPDSEQIAQLRAGVLRAYRWQYILSGAQHPRFTKLLFGMITPAQGERVVQALASLSA